MLIMSLSLCTRIAEKNPNNMKSMELASVFQKRLKQNVFFLSLYQSWKNALA